MKIPTLSADLIDALRSRFFAKDRSIYLASNCLAYLSNGAYLSNAFISETVLSASAASVTFSNIPQGFRHLLLYTQTRTDAAAEIDNCNIRFNGDSGTNYDFQQLFANAATAAASTTRATNQLQAAAEAANSRAASFGPSIMFILGYSATGMEKHALNLTTLIGNVSADADIFTLLRFGHWRNTNVITTIGMTPNVGTNLVAGSRFQLYGIL